MNHPNARDKVLTSGTKNCDAVSAVTDLGDLRVRLGGLSKQYSSSALAAVLPTLSSSIDQLMTEHQGMADELLCLYEQLGIVFEVTRKLAGVQNESDVLDLFLVSLRRSFEGRAVFAARPVSPNARERLGEGITAGSVHGWVLDGAGSRVSSNARERWSEGQPRGQCRDSGVEARGTVTPCGDGSYEVDEWLRGLLDRTTKPGAPGVFVESAVGGEVFTRGVIPGGITASAPTPVSVGAMVSREAIAEVMIAPVISGDVLVCSLVLLRTRQSPAFRASEMMLIESLTTFCGDLIRSHRLVRELREMSLAMVRSLVNAVDQKDEYTCGHSLRVAYYATTLGQRLGLGEVDLQMLQWAALLHDVGKIGIRDNVLKKEGKLTPEEFEHIKEHPVRSHRVVQEVPQLLQALDGILHHHERYDGSGYPAGLKGEQIPLQARIIQIADVFDALTSNRSYRKAFDWQRALGILQEEAGKTVDPRLQKTFDALIRETLAAPTLTGLGADEGVIGVPGHPTAWERMFDQANRFMQGLDAGAVEPEGK